MEERDGKEGGQNGPYKGSSTMIVGDGEEGWSLTTTSTIGGARRGKSRVTNSRVRAGEGGGVVNRKEQGGIPLHSPLSLAYDAAGSPEEDLSPVELEVQECSRTSEDREIKDKLMRKYSGYISSLKHEFSKKKKKGKLPREARQMLLDWWTIHYKWPYPTEADKVELAESTGLDQKQINNWFINQRKRHWKPSENMQFTVMDSIYGPFF
ncbi:unnamed protein product [Ilex paraguariensis]|uniref:Uncharacterized protein n=1 Tax=Ilex paraguariensis TaxID=185542 RepID=A0ABC8R2E2_9AQUA